jgi:release factor glutamine methyltransferase
LFISTTHQLENPQETEYTLSFYPETMEYRKGVFLKELYLLGRDLLRKSGVENPELEVSLLLSKALGINTVDIYTYPKKEVELDKVKEFKRLLERRLKREPIAYILGEKEFYSRSFIVTPDVLIPRPETEILVEEGLNIIRNISCPFVLDVGTGSGCVAVAIGCECENARIFATDISSGALWVARANSKRHRVAKKISFICADFLICFKEQSFDIVLSNPPYIAESDFYKLESDVKDFEPKVSLLGGKDGLNCIKKIVSQAGRVLKNEGWCIIEVGANQSERVSEIFEGIGFKDVSIVKDLSGIERVIKGKWIR